MKMSDTSEKDRSAYRQLLKQLDQLEQEQQTLDLSDAAAVDAFERKLATLRSNLERLKRGAN
jgi:hypothetical protein